MKHAIYSSKVVTPDDVIAATIFIDGETIVGVERGQAGPDSIPADINFIDVGNLVVSPGVIDAHVHINEPGRTDWEGFETATLAAAAGGVTTLVDMPLNSSPVTTTSISLRTKMLAAQGKCHVDVGFYAGLIPGNESGLESLIRNGVLGVKAFLCDSGLDEFPAADEKTLRAALPILKPSGIPLLAHAELISNPNSPQPLADPRSYQQYANSRPPDFELAAIELLIKLCREFETPIHIVHLATAKALPMIAAAKSEGLPLTVETCPHYLYFDDTDIDAGQTEFKCAPPIRDIANRMLLCEAVADGTIDTIGSDHSPCPPDLKQQGNFEKAWGGIAGLQLTLPAVWSVGKALDWSLSLLAEKLSAGPAKVFGLKNKGRIEPGYDADLVVWDPEQSFTVNGPSLFHRHDVTPYEGRELVGVPQQTWLRGTRLFEAGNSDSHFGSHVCGAFVKRERQVATVTKHQVAGYLNSLSTEQREHVLETCCASRAWIRRMFDSQAFAHDGEVLGVATLCWQGLTETDYLEAFSAHPRIGDVNSLRKKYSNTKRIAGNEQAGVQTASQETLERLAEANEEYFKKFGFIFIVFATGKSADEMLQILEERMGNDRVTEIRNAAAAQLEITKLRLNKLPGTDS